MTNPNRVLNEKEASEYLGIVSVNRLRLWRQRFYATGVLKGPRFLKLEGKVGYRVRDLDAYLAAGVCDAS